MGSGVVKANSLSGFAVNHYQVPLNMALSYSRIISRKFMFSASGRQRFFPYKFYNYIKGFIQIYTALFQEFKVFFKLVSEIKIKHSLIFQQFFPYLLKFVRFMPFCWYIASHHSFPFCNSSNYFGAKTRVSCYGIPVLCANGAIIWCRFGNGRFVRNIRSRSKSDNCSSSRDFAGYVNNQAPVSRYVYGLCDGHGLSVA